MSQMKTDRKRVAIIGAGSSGLAAIKSCKEEGFVPVCYERNMNPGGLWRYHDEDLDGVASVMKTTIINTSKEVSAFSDFPPPADFPNFMHNSKMFEYFMLYAQKFDLIKHIKFNLEVVKVEPTSDFSETGRWIVTVKSTKTEATSREEFDAVMVCMGHHVYPKVPTFPGQEKFQGTIVHTHSLKSCDRFLDQKVVVVGIGNSAVDAAVDCTFSAEKVYLSTRRGTWLFGRLGSDGLPYDITFSNRITYFLRNNLPFSIKSAAYEHHVNQRFDHATYKLKPKHRIFGAHPTVSDHLPTHILSGRVTVKGDIKQFEKNGVIFEGEDEVTECDSVILATGYHIKFPFFKDDILCSEENKINMYKFMLPVHLGHFTLSFIGLTQPLGPIFPVAEMQCRLFMQILAQNIELPSLEDMLKDISQMNSANSEMFVHSTRHTIQIDFMPYLEEMAKMIGVKPNLLKLAITDPRLYWACVFGPFIPCQYRLQGPHAWPGAREAILTCMDRVYTPLNVSKNFQSKSLVKKGVGLVSDVLSLSLYCATFLAIGVSNEVKNRIRPQK